MRAWVQEELGGPMALKEVPEPVPGPGEVLLEVEAVGLNFADHLMRLGGYLTRVRPPFTPGMEAVGRVGGRRYAALMPYGALAERVVKALGLRVLGAASRPEKLPLVQALGADALATYEALPEGVRELGGVDLVLEVRGKAVEESLDFLKARGRLVYIGAAEGEVAPINPLRLMRKNLAVLGFWLAPLLRERPLLEEALGFLLPRLGREMRPVVGAVFPFAEAEAAFQALLDRWHTWKIVVRL